MSLTNLLHTGRSGLLASQVGIQTAGQNITNAGVKGYNARNIVLSPTAPTVYGGRGVEVTALIRTSDPLLHRVLLRDEGDTASADARSNALLPVSQTFNELEGSGLGVAIDDLWASFRLLSAQPSDMAAREEVLSRVSTVSSAFNDLASMIQQERLNADDRVRASASRLNELGQRVAEINEEISVGVAQGGGQELMDRRDALILEVASIVDTKVIHNDDSTITLVVAGGLPLVERGNARHVRVDPGSAPGEAMLQMEGAGGIWLNMNDRIASGEIAGLLQVRDGDLDAIETRLDQLAFDVATVVDAQHSAGVGLDGVGGRALFDPIGVVDGAAGRISLAAGMFRRPDFVAAATVTGLDGDNRNALALADLSGTNFAAGGTTTAAEEVASLEGMAASTARQALDQAASRQAAKAQTNALWEQQVGVSIDEEMIDLITYEKAFQAASKLVALADELVAAVLSMKR